jgi:DNA-directed RNA polymerase II subunit RPB2
VCAHSAVFSDSLADLVYKCLDHALLIESCAYLMEYIGREGTKEATTQRRQRYVEHILANELLPHQGLEATQEVHHRKATYLATIILKLVSVYRKECPADDRDDYSLKRVETTGGLFALLFRQLYRQFLKMLSLQCSRAADLGKTLSVVDVAHAKKITSGMKFAVSTGLRA